MSNKKRVLGGGKAVIIGDSSKDKTPELLQRFGKFVDTLSGNYITAEDVGMCADDMTHIRKETLHVTGLPQEMGGGGDPSPVTAYGVYMGMKASAKFLWGSDDLEGKRVLVQGVGHVGENVVKHLSEESPIITALPPPNAKPLIAALKVIPLFPIYKKQHHLTSF